MSTQVQRRKGTTAQHASFTGASAELTVDTTKNTVVVHDGATAGGIPLAKETGSALSVTSLTSSGAAVIETTDNTNAALRITQLGTGNALLIEDSASPDSTPVAIDASGRLIVGATSIGAFAAQIQSRGLNTFSAVYEGDDTNPPIFNFFKNRAGATVVAGDDIGRIAFCAYDGVSAYPRAAQILAEVDATPSATSMPGRLSFSTTSAGATTPTERMRLDNAGNLGLGVTPSAWVDDKAVQLPQGAISSGYDYGISVTSVCYRTSSNAWLYKVTGQAPTRYHAEGGSFKWYTAPSGTAGTALTFTQAMTLDSSGNLLVGTTSAIGRVGSAFPNTQYGFTASCTSASGTAIFNRFLYNTSTEVGSISSTGTATLYNTTSDQRLKKNIQDAAPASALIDALQVREYDWKSDGSHQRYGFVAQELVTVAPEAVYQPTNPEEMMAVDYSKLVPMLVKELQSLRARVAQLESK